MRFGDFILSLGQDNKICYWSVAANKLFDSLDVSSAVVADEQAAEGGDAARITCIMHPSTYLNKIVIATDRGVMQV